MQLVTEIYKVTQAFPAAELYGLVSQLMRAAVSMPSNLAEGYSRNSRVEPHHFVGQARGSLAEIETQVEIASSLGYLSFKSCAELQSRISEVGRLLTGLRAWSGKVVSGSSFLAAGS